MLQMERSVEEAVADSEEARHEFEDLFREQYLRLGQALYLLTEDPGEAEDLAQEAMARVYERWPRVRAMASPTGYLYRTALNLSRRRFLRLRRERGAASHSPVEDPAERVDRRVTVLAALRSLSKEQREALVLTEWLELPAEEAGAVLGISADSVRARAYRAREALRIRIGDTDG
jgi:RNA polymerase sigma-70 factor (ECF subfamily)